MLTAKRINKIEKIVPKEMAVGHMVRNCLGGYDEIIAINKKKKMYRIAIGHNELDHKITKSYYWDPKEQAWDDGSQTIFEEKRMREEKSGWEFE